MTALAGGDLALPAGIQVSDLEYISVRVLAIAVVVTLIGVLALKRFAARSIGLMITIVVAATVITMLAGVGVIAYRMVGTPGERDDVLDLMAIAGLAGLAVALFVGRRLTKASRALSSAVQGVGENGVYVAPQLTLPTELAELSAELTVTHERLAQARSRERPWRPAGASSSPGSATTCALRWPACGHGRSAEDQVVIDPREVSQYHSQIRREVTG